MRTLAVLLALGAAEPAFPPAARHALAGLVRALAAHPDDADVQRRRARLLFDLGRDEEARAAEAAAARIVPRRSIDRFLAEGKALWDSQQTEAAIALWELGAAAFPDEPRLARNLGFARFSRGEYAAAERLYRRALELLPGEPGLQTDLAWALLRQDRREEAKALADAVLAAQPDDAAARAILERLAAPR